MVAVTFDTHWAIKQLISKGISQDQAEVFVNVIRESRKADMESVVTNADMKAALAELKAELIKWMFSGFIAIIALLVTILMKLH